MVVEMKVDRYISPYYVSTCLCSIEHLKCGLVDLLFYRNITIYMTHSGSWRIDIICIKFKITIRSCFTKLYVTVGKPRTDSVPPTMQSQIPKSRDVTLFFLDITLYKCAAMHCLRRHPMCFY